MLNGKTCIVSGGASGIGKATARECATQGARVVIVDINPQALAATVAELAVDALTVEAVQANLALKADVDRMIATVLDLGNGIDAIINSHGITHRLDTIASETSEDIFDLTIDTNLKSVFLICGAALPHMRERGGAIVNVASVGALIGWGGISYTASKGGLVAMTRQIAYQEAVNNIRCNSLLPGRVDTAMSAVLATKEHMAVPPTIPGALQRKATPDEIAYLATFLVSDRAAYITGATYVVDGGMSQH